MNESIKIIATKRTCKAWKEEDYDIKIVITPEIKKKGDNYMPLSFHTDKSSISIHKNVYDTTIEGSIWSVDGHVVLRDSEHYSKSRINHNIDIFKKFIPISIEFDENTWTPSKAWSIDISKQITVKVLRPSGMQFMGSTIVKGEVFTTIKNTPPDYPVDYGFVEYPENEVCETVAQLVSVLFHEIDILGAEVKIDGKILTYNEANQIRPRNIKLIEIFL